MSWVVSCSRWCGQLPVVGRHLSTCHLGVTSKYSGTTVSHSVVCVVLSSLPRVCALQVVSLGSWPNEEDAARAWNAAARAFRGEHGLWGSSTDGCVLHATALLYQSVIST